MSEATQVGLEAVAVFGYLFYFAALLRFMAATSFEVALDRPRTRLGEQIRKAFVLWGPIL